MQSKEPAEIQQAALEEAKRRLAGGCRNCAEGYVRVALQHGATRRQVIKAGLGAMLALGAGGIMLGSPRDARAYGPCQICQLRFTFRCRNWRPTPWWCWRLCEYQCVDYFYGLICRTGEYFAGYC
jgi:hypothetical protein